MDLQESKNLPCCSVSKKSIKGYTLKYMEHEYNIKVITSEIHQERKLVNTNMDNRINVLYYFNVKTKTADKNNGFIVSEDFKIQKVYYCKLQECWTERNLDSFELVGYHENNKYFLNHKGEKSTEIINVNEYKRKYSVDLKELELGSKYVLISDNQNIKECLILCFETEESKDLFLKYILICRFFNREAYNYLS